MVCLLETSFPYGLDSIPLPKPKSSLLIGSSKVSDYELKGRPTVRRETRNGVGITAHIKGYHVTCLNVSFRHSALSLEALGRRRPYLLVRKLWRKSKWILVRAIEMVILVVHSTRLRDMQIDGRIWLLSVSVRMSLDVRVSVSGSQTWTLDWIMMQTFFFWI